MPAFAAAHRGLSSEKAENTLASFGAAATAGFAAIELDLHATRDGVAVVLHDEDLARTTNGVGDVGTLDWDAVARFSTKDGAVPRLDELLAAMKLWDGGWNLELKVAEAAKPAAIAARQAPGPVLFSSMFPQCLEGAKQYAPDTPRALIPLGPPDEEDFVEAKRLGCTWLNVDHDFVDPDDVATIRDAGFRVAVWTVNSLERARELAAAGAECIITDMRDVGASFPAPCKW